MDKLLGVFGRILREKYLQIQNLNATEEWSISGESWDSPLSIQVERLENSVDHGVQNKRFLKTPHFHG